MPKRIIGGWTWRGAHCAPALLCLILCACTSPEGTAFLLLADPGKYLYYNCKQLDGTRNAALARQKGLKGLIDKAEAEAGGVLVGAVAYRADYAAVTQDIATIDATAREKNCTPQSAAAPAAAPPPPTTWRSNSAIQ